MLAPYVGTQVLVAFGRRASPGAACEAAGVQDQAGHAGDAGHGAGLPRRAPKSLGVYPVRGGEQGVDAFRPTHAACGAAEAHAGADVRQKGAGMWSSWPAGHWRQAAVEVQARA